MAKKDNSSFKISLEDSNGSEQLFANNVTKEGGEVEVESDGSELMNLATLKQLNPLLTQQIMDKFQDKLETSIEEIRKEIKSDGQQAKKDTFTIFGIFSSIVTFLSIQVQIFKTNDDVIELIGVSSITLSFILFFINVLDNILKDKTEWCDFFKPTYVLNLILLVFGVTLLYCNPKQDLINASKNSSANSHEIVKEIKTDSIKNSKAEMVNK